MIDNIFDQYFDHGFHPITIIHSKKLSSKWTILSLSLVHVRTWTDAEEVEGANFATAFFKLWLVGRLQRLFNG